MPLQHPIDQAGVPPVATIAQHYDTLDFFYRDIWGEHIHHGLWVKGSETPAQATEQMSRYALGRLELQPGDRLADIGCGYGGTARLAAREHGANVVGFTVSEAQKRYADLWCHCFLSQGSPGDIAISQFKTTGNRGFAVDRLEGWQV